MAAGQHKRGRLASSVAAVAILVTLPPAMAADPATTPYRTSDVAGRPQAWTLDAMHRVWRSTPPRQGTDIVIHAARGETEPFQIAVHGTGGRLTGGDLSVSRLNGPHGAVIPASAVTRYREEFVPVRRHSPDYYGEPIQRRWFPDPLLPFVDPRTGEPPDPDAEHAAYPYTVDAGRTQPFWIDIRVPRGTMAGRYVGTWTIRTDQGSVRGEVALVVRDFTLPRRPAEDSLFGIYRNPHRAAKERLLVSFGVQPAPVDPSREAALFAGGLKSSDLGFWSGADIKTCTMDPAPTRRAVARAVALHDRRLKLLNYTADEISRCPGLNPRLKTYARRLHSADVDQLVVMIPRRSLLDDGTGEAPTVDKWVLLPVQARKLSAGLVDDVRDTGGELWSYQALVQGAHTPSWELDMPPVNYRILPGFLNASQGYTGILYWTVDYWRPNPWRDVVYDDSGCCYPGEGLLVYPGGAAGVSGPIPSMRLAWVREGIEDYGYVDLLRRSGASRVERLLAPAARSWRTWTQDPHVVGAVRSRLAAAIGAAADVPAG